jgi:hypothetical protein
VVALTRPEDLAGGFDGLRGATGLVCGVTEAELGVARGCVDDGCKVVTRGDAEVPATGRAAPPGWVVE